MFAIALRPDTIHKIPAEFDISASDMTLLESLALRGTYYFISGYVTRRGAFVAWTFLPERLFVDVFAHDPTRILSDWDQITRI